jgi:diaminopimelate epimerase
LKATVNIKSRPEKSLGNAIRTTHHFLANFHKQTSKTFSSLKIFSFSNSITDFIPTIQVNMKIKKQLENVKHLGRAWKEESMHEIPVKLLRQDTHTHTLFVYGQTGCYDFRKIKDTGM